MYIQIKLKQTNGGLLYVYVNNIYLQYKISPLNMIYKKQIDSPWRHLEKNFPLKCRLFFLGKQQICSTTFIPVLFCKLVRKSLI